MPGDALDAPSEPLPANRRAPVAETSAASLEQGADEQGADEQGADEQGAEPKSAEARANDEKVLADAGSPEEDAQPLDDEAESRILPRS
jgi:hypothetical protein